MASPLLARYKVVLVGDPGVGKSSLVRRYVEHSFTESYLKTVGTSVARHRETIPLEAGANVDVHLIIWDVMGQRDSMKLLQDAYFTGTHGALAVFEVGRPETLWSLETWIGAAKRGSPQMPVIILGNKVDMEDRRLSDEEAGAFASRLGLRYLPTSAKSGLNVEEAFRLLCQEALRTFAPVRVRVKG
jgi:small GTP-binding protein